MICAVAGTDLVQAYRVLFGPEAMVSSRFLLELKPCSLKAAYRRKAMETHPDRARLLGGNETEMSRRFKEVSMAYEVLRRVVNGRKKRTAKPGTNPSRTNATNTNGGSKAQSRFSDHFHKGRLPNRTLLVGQYLYYSGAISWKTLINAIVWQRKERPTIGQIAQDWGMLSYQDVQSILVGRTYREKFGECALRKGYINTFQLMALLGRQRRMQRPIGNYFTRKGILSSSQINGFVENLRTHNQTIAWGRYTPRSKWGHNTR